MHAMIEYDEAKRIQDFLRQYAHLGREDGNCTGCDDSDRYPVMVGWADESPFDDRKRFLVFDVDEKDIPPLHVVATDDGNEYSGHTYTDVLRENVDSFIRHTNKPHPRDKSVKTLTIYIDQEMSYEWEYMRKEEQEQQVSVSSKPEASTAYRSEVKPEQSEQTESSQPTQPSRTPYI